MTDFPGTNDWYGPAVNRGIPKDAVEHIDGDDRRKLQLTRRAALVQANNTRATLGLPAVAVLAPGKPKDPYHCPLAETIRGDDDVSVRVQYDEIRVEGRVVTLTEAVSNFQCWVDAGFYPDLIR